MKYKLKYSFLKLEPFIPMGSKIDSLLFDPFIVSRFFQHGQTKAVTSHLFTSLFMFIHLPLIHFTPPPRLLIDFQNSKWLTYFCILYIIMHLYCFSFLQGKIQLDNCTVIMDFSRSKSVMEVHKDWICGKVMSLRKIANCFFFYYQYNWALVLYGFSTDSVIQCNSVTV